LESGTFFFTPTYTILLLVGDTNSKAELAKLTYFGSNFDNHKNYGTPFRTNDKV